MRRNAGSWIVKVLLGVIALVFIFFMGGGGQIRGGQTSVAVVGETQISIADLQRAQNRNQAFYREQYGDRLTPDVLQALDIPSLSLGQLVDQAVLRSEAERLGLLVPDDAVRSEIREVTAFHRDGQFSPATYRAVMERQGMSAAAFETSLRNDLLVEQLVDVVRRGVHVTEDEAFEEFKRESEQMVLAYVKVPRDDLTDAVDITDDGLTSYFQDNREQYRRPDSVSIRYLAYTFDSFADPAAVSEESIEEYYVLNKESEFTTEETVSARHILKKFPDDADDEAKQAVRDAIDAVVARLEAGEDFAKVAEEESEDPGSGAGGGDLGSFGRGKMVQPFEEAAFALAAGETSDVVESSFGYHVIHVYDRQEASTKSLEEARDEIAATIAREDARDLAFDASAGDALDIREGAAKLETIAEERGIEIETTPLLARGDVVPGIGEAAAFVDAALALSGTDDVSDTVRVGDAYYVLQVAERRDSYIPELDEVREDVEQAYRKEQATALAREKATAVLGELKAGKGVEEAAEGFESDETREFSRRGAFVPGLGNVPGLKELAFATVADGEALPRVFVHRGDAYAFVRKSFVEADREAFEADKEARLETLRRKREQAAISEFIRGLKERTEIAYNQQLLEQILQ